MNFTTTVNRLFSYFRRNPHKAINLGWLCKKNGVTRGTVIRYVSAARKMCPRGWRIKTQRVKDKYGITWVYYTYCPTLESFRKQQEIFQERKSA